MVFPLVPSTHADTRWIYPCIYTVIRLHPVPQGRSTYFEWVSYQDLFCSCWFEILLVGSRPLFPDDHASLVLFCFCIDIVQFSLFFSSFSLLSSTLFDLCPNAIGSSVQGIFSWRFSCSSPLLPCNHLHATIYVFVVRARASFRHQVDCGCPLIIPSAEGSVTANEVFPGKRAYFQVFLITTVGWIVYAQADDGWRIFLLYMTIPLMSIFLAGSRDRVK
jgi:hypothetical protein